VKNWQIILISILITLAIGGTAICFLCGGIVRTPGVIEQQIANQRPDLDKLSVIRAFFPAHFEDTLRWKAQRCG
jgi:uncharacterized membrane-anchored protein YhcB (DUF1043 family)